MQPHESNQGQVAFWEAAGPVWQREQEQLDAQISEHGARAVEELAPAEGESIIDIGCGTGTSTFHLAECVGDRGRVTGYDISPTMIDAATARASEAGVNNVDFVVADAHTQSFDATADAAFSRFGVMFFGDPKGAFSNIRTALRPGGRLAFVCWQSPAQNPWITKTLAVVRNYVELPFGTDPRAPGPFAFADPEWVREILDDAGFADVALKPFEAQVYLGPDVDSAVRFVLGINPMTAGIEDRDPDTAKLLFAEVAEAFEVHLTDRGVATEAATWIVTARNP